MFALVNNAGIYHPAKNSKASNGYPLTIMTNYLGGYCLSKLFLPLLEKNDDSRLIFECSIAANFNKFKSLDFLSKSMKNTNIEYNLSKLAIGKAFCYLANQGYVTIINDHRGHGKSIKEKEDLGFFYDNSSEYIVEDLLKELA